MNAHVVVGVIPGQPAAVVETAADIAARYDADLVCASVDIARYTVAQSLDGTIIASSIDPELMDERPETFDPLLEESIGRTLADRGISYSVRALAGNPAVELAALAEEVDAVMIVVGTREAGLRGSLREFFSGSVAVHLAHHQHRPVVVVPLDPKPHGTQLPWAGAD
ncbi:universal stress protein [Brachybacterium hainanense]|uniref:Universal stress protein n=1 Tax=Brachybacterium hainanense TaxID=1541174 RepID=A0ABV6RCQ9_9MICO